MGILHGVEMTLSYILHSIFRFIQIILAITVCALYGVDLNKANREKKYSDGKWVFAEVTASLSAFMALLYIIPFVSRVPFAWVVDTILFILWISLFGLFGNMYIKANAQGDSGIERMKHAVWVDLANALLWLISAVGMLIFWARHRSSRTRWTGRAKV